MRRFKLLNSEGNNNQAAAIVVYDEDKRTWGASICDWAKAKDLPVQFIKETDGIVDPEFVHAWVEERIPPATRQNIGQILREHGLDEYDECELLAKSKGRSLQDGFYLKEITGVSPLQDLIGKNIAEARKNASITQKELSEATGIHQETLSRIESGRVNPTVDTLEKIAAALGKTLKITFE